MKLIKNIVFLTWSSASFLKSLGEKAYVNDFFRWKRSWNYKFWGKALKIKSFRDFQSTGNSNRERKRKYQRWTQTFFFKGKVGVDGEYSCEDCKTAFHKRFISSDRGRLLSGTLINASPFFPALKLWVLSIKYWLIHIHSMTYPFFLPQAKIVSILLQQIKNSGWDAY